ncbi:MAG: DUF6265 family protein [Bacteroidales bacterium]
MKFRRIVLLLIVCPLVFSCQDTHRLLNENFEKIIVQLPGLWKIDNADYYEEWEKAEQIYEGRSYSIKGNDTVVLELIRIYHETGNIIYEPTVFGQNDGNPIKFELISADSASFTFENKLHDFPQQISYSFLSENKLAAKISGIVDGKEEQISFNFTKQ